MTTETKTVRASFKAAAGSPEGTVEAIVSVFGNVDYGGDRVLPGAFTDTLAEWASRGDPIPFIWSHAWDDPFAHIGVVLDAAERTEGLWVKAAVDLDKPFAKQVHDLLIGRRVTQFSFGYEAVQSQYVEQAMADMPDRTMLVRDLVKVNLFEVGPTLLGMNPDTQLIEAASRAMSDAKAGRALTAKDVANLRSVHALLGDLLAPKADDTPSDDPKAVSSDTDGTMMTADQGARLADLMGMTRHMER